MPTYEYQAEQSDGVVVGGVVFGTSLDHAARDLAAQGLKVVRIGVAASIQDPLAGQGVTAPAPASAVVSAPASPAAGGPVYSYEPAPRPQERSARESASGIPTPPTEQPEGPDITSQRSYVATSVVGPLVGKVALTNLLFFFRQLASMMDAGVPLVQSLETLAGQSKDPRLSRIIRELSMHVKEGRPMSAGVQRYPEVFSPIMVSLMRAGEEGGFLASSLTTIADYIDREIALRNLYRRVTFYPKLQIVASIIIIIGANLIIASVAPGGKGLSSPLTTISTWYWLGPLIIAAFLFLRVGLANPRIKYNWDMFVSHIPYLGKTIRQLAMAKFGRAFGALYKGGVPITRSLQLSADACGNEYLRAKMYPAYRKLEQGDGIGNTFRETGAFSPVVLDMVQTGETTGSLDQMLVKVAEFYEDEAGTRSSQLGLVTGVILGLFVAAYIGYIVITFYVGYFSGIDKAVNQ